MLVLALERIGWEVFAAKDGRDALRIYHDAIEHDEYFDVLLLDVHMPRLNGFAVGVNVRNLETYSDVKRAIHIYFTGRDDNDVMPPGATPEDLMEILFADAYIHKPVGPSDLIAQIERLTKEAAEQ